MRNHAKFCLPLLMANQLGTELLCPLDAMVEWDGKSDARIAQSSEVSLVSTHSADGSFTVQLNLVLSTKPGWFTLVKGLANERRLFHVMEGLIESWWAPSNFGIVCLFAAPGVVQLHRGEPLAVALPLPAESLGSMAALGSPAEQLPQHLDFNRKRARSDYRRDLDYMKGRWPDGTKVCPHYTSAAQARRPGYAFD